MTSQMITKWRKVMPRLFFSEVLHNITVLYRQDVFELAMCYFFFLYLDHFARNQDNSPTIQLTDTVFETIHRQILRQFTDTSEDNSPTLLFRVNDL